MKFALSILALAAIAIASPLDVRTGGGPPKSISDADKACGSSSVVSCCNGSSESDSSGLISAIVGPILANGCLGVSLSALNILGPLIDTGAMCGSNTVKCCTGNKNSGLLVIDLQCTSL
ncbi:hypothetical protein EJ04DRAFT_525826 [Polyplosphaeria fusca]|uniref:Hydrophobin n=1 Tax=Polyplosphaeria fusca TaxID=682080 RepID=A0A9P4QVG1_9PLEO|nr:hypothetical protein EJ04DRAFT_525826 [Polyplosphaeria fusca]